MIPLKEAKIMAIDAGNKLFPWCDRINIAGSIRRGKSDVGDIEIVCQPKMIVKGTVTLFGEDDRKLIVHPDFESTVLKLGKVIKGNPGGRMMQIELEYPFGGVKTVMLDLFMPKPYDYFRVFAIRTGSADYSAKVIASGWRKNGWVGTENGLRLEDECYGSKGLDGKVKWRCVADNPTLPPVWESEQEFFKWVDIQYLPPHVRYV